MVALLCLLTLLAIAAYTDFRWRKIYNRTVYPGILLALAANAIHSLDYGEGSGPGWDSWGGWVGLTDSAAGFLACGFIMLVCFVFFGIGGGDVKLVAMIGAFLGLERGLQAMLWTFILGGMVGLCLLIWKIGAGALLVRACRQLLWGLRLGRWQPLPEDERAALRMKLFLAPMAIPAVLLAVAWGSQLWM